MFRTLPDFPKDRSVGSFMGVVLLIKEQISSLMQSLLHRKVHMLKNQV